MDSENQLLTRTRLNLPENLDGLLPIEKAILQTLAYADIYDYPLSRDEIHRYLVGIPATLPEVDAALHNGHAGKRLIGRRGEYYTLADREQLVETRIRRSQVARQLWPEAVHYGQLIASLPYVKMIACTGSLAVDNADLHSDIDYLIVTASGRLWITRALVILVVRFAARRGAALCPNYFVTERALEFEEHNLYTAHEVAQMVPLAGLNFYAAMRAANQWVNDFLPNAHSNPMRVDRIVNDSSLARRSVRRFLEMTLDLPPGDWIEKWERQRKVRKFSSHNGADESSFSSDRCKGHFDSHGRHAMEAFDRHWQDIGGIPGSALERPGD